MDWYFVRHSYADAVAATLTLVQPEQSDGREREALAAAMIVSLTSGPEQSHNDETRVRFAKGRPCSTGRPEASFAAHVAVQISISCRRPCSLNVHKLH